MARVVGHRKPPRRQRLANAACKDRWGRRRSLHTAHIGAIIMKCDVCGREPCASPDFCASCAKADACTRKKENREPVPEHHTLEQVHAVFRKWLGNDYDIGALNSVLAVAASERLSGDPAWLLIISGPGNAKTETCQSLSKLDAHIVSTISSEGALLSGTSDKNRAKGATGGLLRKIGDRGLLVVKDFTSILSANRDTRASVLAALREVHDGNWTRNVGTDGGRTLTWSGRVVLIGACTTAWDQAHAVIAAMGDRFVLVRSDSSGAGRVTAGKRAIRNTGVENVMRKDLSEAVAGLISHVSANQSDDMTDQQVDQILEAANIVTLARTGVEIDYRGDVIDAHAPEMPTRFARQLTQVLRGARAIGMKPPEAMELVIRCARDSMPPLRLAILEDIGKHPDSRIIDVRRRLQRPRATADRALQALHVLGLLTCREEEHQRNDGPRYVRHYSLSPTVDLKCLYQICQYSERKREDKGAEAKKSTSKGGGNIPSEISGTGAAPTNGGATLCDHCGTPGKLNPYHWDGRPDGIVLHSSCEGPWFDSEKGRLQ
jgi:hypothetical protein